MSNRLFIYWSCNYKKEQDGDGEFNGFHKKYTDLYQNKDLIGIEWLLLF